jgi:hypothetical protein
VKSILMMAVSGSHLNEMPVTVLRGGISPVFEIADKIYNYDTATHCMIEAGTPPGDCSKSLKVMSGKKVVALIEGQGRITISAATEKGQRDFAQPYYQMMVERDSANPSRPRFVMEAMSAEGKTLGRIDGVEGFTAPDLAKFKGKLASAHHLIDLRSKSVVYANCRKLAVMHFNDSHFVWTPDRNVASKSKPVLKMGSTTSASLAPPTSFAPPPSEASLIPPMAQPPTR